MSCCCRAVLCAVRNLVALGLLLPWGSVAGDPPPATWPTPDGNFPTFDQYHRMSREDQKQVELYWMMMTYEQDPKWDSNYHFTATGYVDDGVAKVPGWLRDGAWSWSAAVDAVLYGEPVGESKIYGSCADTSARVQDDLSSARQTFLATYYPETPPAGSYIPPDWTNTYQQGARNCQWDFEHSNESVWFSPLEPFIPGVPGLMPNHQVVFLHEKGKNAHDDATVSYVLDPWGTGYPEVLTPKVAKSRDYLFSGKPVKRRPGAFDKQPGDTGGTGGSTGSGTGTGEDPPVTGGGGGSTTLDPPTGGATSGGEEGTINWSPPSTTVPPVNRDNPDDNINAGYQLGRRDGSRGEQADRLVQAWIRQATRRGDSLVADLLGQRAEYLLIDSRGAPSGFLDPEHIWYLDYASRLAISGIGTASRQLSTRLRGIPSIAVLAHGHYRQALDVLNYHALPAAVVNHEDLAELSRWPVLLAPSGAFEGLEGSPATKAALDSYVRAGGVLIVLDQPDGQNFLAAPGTDGVAAQGWQQDQSCAYRSVTAGTYHPSIAGQLDRPYDLHVDGFFTAWPDTFTPVLIRERNPVPAMLVGNVGSGVVVLTTTFPDWGQGYGVWSNDDSEFLRDLCLWALHPHDPWFHDFTGSTLPFHVDITNRLAATATNASFQVVDPSGVPIGAPWNVATNTAAGAQAGLDTQVILPAVGLYEIDVTLQSAGGDSDLHIDAMRFASLALLPTDAGGTTTPSISVAPVTTKEGYLPGEHVPLTVHVYNTSSTARTIDVAARPPWNLTETVQAGITLPAHGETEASFDFVPPSGSSGYAAFNAFVRTSGTAEQLAYGWRWVLLGQAAVPKVEVAITPSLLETDPGETVGIDVLVTKPYSGSDSDTWTCRLDVLDPSQAVIHTENFGASPQGSSFSHSTQLILGGAAPSGAYTIVCRATKGTDTGGGSAVFLVRKAFNAHLETEDGDWTVLSGDTVTLHAIVSSTRSGGIDGTAHLVFAPASFDVATPFHIDGRGTADIPFAVSLPGDLVEGVYQAVLTVDDGHGELHNVQGALTVPPPKIDAQLVHPTLQAGNNQEVTIQNDGNNIPTLDCTAVLVLKDGDAISTATLSGPLASGEARTLQLPIPADLASGHYVIRVACTAVGMTPYEVRRTFTLDGRTGTITAVTNKPVYPTAASMTLSSQYSYDAASLPGGEVAFDILDDNVIKPAGRTQNLRGDARRIASDSTGRIAAWGPGMGIKIWDAGHHLVASMGDTRLSQPPIPDAAIAFDPSNNLLLLDKAGRQVRVYAVGGGTLTLQDTHPLRNLDNAEATALAAGPDGRYYVARGASDTQPNQALVETYNADGSFAQAFGTWGSGVGQVKWISHLFVDAAHRIFLCDPVNRQALGFTNVGAYMATYHIDNLVPEGIIERWDTVSVLTEDPEGYVETEYVYQFEDDGTYDGKSGVYLTQGRDLILTHQSAAPTALLDASSVYGAEIRFFVGSGSGQVDVLQGLKSIDGIVKQDDGSLLCADNAMVWKIAPDGTLTEWADGWYQIGIPSEYAFVTADDIARDSQGHVYVLDSGGSLIRIYGPTGEPFGRIPSGFATLPNEPHKMFITPDDHLHLFCRTGTGSIREILTDGTLVRTVDLSADGGAAADVWDMAVDAVGQIWLARTDGYALYDPEGQLLRKDTSMGLVFAIDANAGGQVWLASSTLRALVELDTDGNVLASHPYLGPTTLITAIRMEGDTALLGLYGDHGSGQVTPVPARVATFNVSSTPAQELAHSEAAAGHRGSHYFQASLVNRFGQPLAIARTPFLVSEDAVAINVATAREVHAPGDVAEILVQATNTTSRDLDDTFTIQLSAGGLQWQDHVALAASSSISFTVPYVTGSATEEITATFAGYRATTPLFVSPARLRLSLEAPAVATMDPFDALVTLENFGNTDAHGTLTVSTSDSTWQDDVDVPAGESRLYTLPAWITAPDTLTATLGDGLNGSASQHVGMGVQLLINLPYEISATPGLVDIPCTITNVGTLGEDIPVTMTVDASTSTMLYHVPAGASVDLSSSVQLDAGRHVLRVLTPYANHLCELHVGTPAFTLPGSVTITNVSPPQDLARRADPGYLAWIPAGGTAMCSFSIRNTSAFAGAAEVILDLPGVFHERRSVFIEGGAQAPLSFGFGVPFDYPNGSHSLNVRLQGESVFTGLYYVQGPAVAMAASLDKNVYAPTEQAHLAVDLTNTGTGALSNLMLTALYQGQEWTSRLDLSTTAQRTFDIPVGTGGPVAVQVTTDAGRTLVIDSLEIRSGQGIVVFVDAQAYTSAATVTATVQTDRATTITLTAPGDNQTSMLFTGADSRNWQFTLPRLARGTYALHWGTEQAEVAGAVFFDVAGPEVVVTQVRHSPDVPRDSCDVLFSFDLSPHAASSSLQFTFHLNDPFGNQVAYWIETVDGNANIPMTATFQRHIAFPSTGTYTLTYVVDEVGGAPEVVTGRLWFDATVTGGHPGVVEFAPGDGAVEVPTGDGVMIRFSRAMNRSSVAAALHVAPPAMLVLDWPAPNLVIAHPGGSDSNWAKSTPYTVHLDATAADTAGNPLATPSSWEFTTGTWNVATPSGFMLR